MEMLSQAQCEMVAGANGGGNYESFNNPKNYTGHTTYGGQGNGFVGTQSNGLDLGSVISNNPCATGIVAGAIAGSGSWAGIAKGVVAGALTGQCFSGGNGNGGGSGNNYGGQCTW